MTTLVSCPKCGSTSLHSQKRGYSAKKGILGMLTFGGVFLGFHGANKVITTCLACGHQFNAGEGKIISKNNNNCDLHTTVPNIDRSSQGKAFVECERHYEEHLPQEIVLDEYERKRGEHLAKRGVKKPLARSAIRHHLVASNIKVVCECGTWNEKTAKYCRSCGVAIEISKLATTKIGQKLETENCCYCNNSTPKRSRKNIYCTQCANQIMTLNNE